MVQHKTFLKILDNSGVKTAQCIRVLGGYKKRYGYIGDLILLSIKNVKFKLHKIKIENKSIFKAIIVQTKIVNYNKTGMLFKFNNNAVILVDNQHNPLATRIKGFILEILKIRLYKLISISLSFI